MYWNGYIEKVGTGTEDIINKCLERGLRTPEFHQEEDFRVVIWRADNDVTNDVTNYSDRIINLIRDNSSVTIRELADEIGIGIRQCKRIMAELKQKGLVSRKGSPRTGEWVLNNSLYDK